LLKEAVTQMDSCFTFYLHKSQSRLMWISDLSCLYRFSFMSQNITSGPCKFSPELLKETVTQMGSCFTFHPSTYLATHGGLVSTRAGAAGGLFLRINIQQFDYLAGRSGAGLKVGNEVINEVFGGSKVEWSTQHYI
jgi:hypothetical protein